MGIPHDKPLDEKVSPFSEESSLKHEKRGRNDSERNEGRASRMNLDLNILLESWSDCTDPSMKKQGVCERIQMSGLRPPSEPIRELNGRDVHFSGLGPSNVPPSLGQNDAEISLDLELKPPCRPEPKFNWLDIGKNDSDAEIIDLSLSLVSSRKKPESCDKGIQQNMEVEFDLQDSTGAVLVKPEPHEGVLNNSISDCFGSATSAPPGYPPKERQKGIVPSNSTSDCFELLKSAAPDYPHQEQPKGIGEASRCKVSSYDRNSASVKEVPQLSCGNKVRDFYCKKIEIDLNSPPIDSDHQSRTPTNSSMPVEAKPEVVFQNHFVENNETQESDDGSHAHTNSSVPMEANEMSAEVPSKVVSQDHYVENNESQYHCEPRETTSPLLKEGVAKSFDLVSEAMELEQEELNSPKDVNGADWLESEGSQGNKPTTPDASSENDSRTAALDGNDPIPSKLASDDVAESDEDGAMEESENGDVAESDEEIENENDDAAESDEDGAMEESENGDVAESDEEIENENDDAAESDEEIVEYEYGDVIEEVSCEDESDGSHDAVDAGDMDSEEYEEVIEEVSCDDESDSSTHHDGDAQDAELELYSPHKEHRGGQAVEEVRGQREVSASHGEEGASSVPVTSPTIGPTHGDVIGENILSPDRCTAMRQSSDLDMKTTIEKRLLSAALKTDQDWETNLGRNKNIVVATEVGNGKQGSGSWETKSDLIKNFAEATKEGNTKQGWDPWETKSTLKKDSVEGTEEGNTKQGWGTRGTKSEEGNKKQGWRSWEMKSGHNKDITEANEKGRHDAGRRENVRRTHPAPYGDARRHEGPFKHSRIINLNNGLDRSSCGKEKFNYARPNRPYAERKRFSDNKSSRQDKPHPGGQKDGRRNDRFRRPENDRNQSNQYGMGRSDYTWVRNDDGQNNDALHDAGQFPNTENAQECSDVSSSRRQLNDTREGETQPGSQRTSHTIRNANPGGRYGGRNTLDFHAPEPREGRMVIRDLPSSSAGHHSFSNHNQQYAVQTENPWTNATFRSAIRSLENSPQPWLGSEHDEMQPSHQRAYYPQNIRAPRRHASTDDEREINPNGLQYNTNHPQRPQEETFRRLRYNHYGEQEETAAADFLDEREYAVRRGHPRPPPYGGRGHALFHDRGRERGVSDIYIRNRPGDMSNGELTVDAEYGFENGPRPRYGQEVHEKFHEGGSPSESRGNIRNRLGGRGTSRGARDRRGRGGNYRFNGREARHDDAEFVEKRRKY